MERQLLTYDDVSKWLRVKIGTLYSWVSRGRIPFIRLGDRVVRFDADVIASWVGTGQANSVAAKSHNPKSDAKVRTNGGVR